MMEISTLEKASLPPNVGGCEVAMSANSTINWLRARLLSGDHSAPRPPIFALRHPHAHAIAQFDLSREYLANRVSCIDNRNNDL